MTLRRFFGAALVAVCGFLVLSAAAAAPPRPFRVSGTVVSTRDGSAVPYCRVTATFSAIQRSAGAGMAQAGTARPTAPAGGPGRGLGGTSGGAGGGVGGGLGGAVGGGLGGGLAQRGQPGAANQPIETRADAGGRFVLELPHAGSWQVAGEARGFRAQSYDEHDGYFASVVLTESNPAFSLTLRLAPDSLLSGLIFDQTGDPVAQAQVSAERIPDAVPGQRAGGARPRPAGFGQTDDRGHYEVLGLTPGKYRLRVQARPWYASPNQSYGMVFSQNGRASQIPVVPADNTLDVVYAASYFPGTDDESKAEIIDLKPGEARQADMYLVAIPSVHLIIPAPEVQQPDPVTQQDSGPVRRNQVQQPRPNVTRIGVDGGFNPISSFAYVDGKWDIGGLVPGTYEVRMTGPDGRPQGEARMIEVRPGAQSVTLENARMLPRVTVSIEGDDRPGGNVSFIDTQTGGQFLAVGAPRGGRGGPPNQPPVLADAPPAGRSVSLPPGTYDVQLNGRGTEYLTGISATGATVTGRSVRILGDASLTLRVAKTRATVDGTAKLGDKPASGAMVLLVPVTYGEAGSFSSVGRDESNTDGSFTIAGVVPGLYILVAIDHGWDVDWRRPEVLAKYLVKGVPVDLTSAGKVRQEIEAAAP